MSSACTNTPHSCCPPWQLVVFSLAAVVFPPLSPVQYVRTPRLRDKLVLHACVVSLWLHGFEMDISTLGKDFALPPRKLVGFFRELGCSYRPTLGAPLCSCPRG
jgi:hypothetical protein